MTSIEVMDNSDVVVYFTFPDCVFTLYFLIYLSIYPTFIHRYEMILKDYIEKAHLEQYFSPENTSTPSKIQTNSVQFVHSTTEMTTSNTNTMNESYTAPPPPEQQPHSNNTEIENDFLKIMYKNPNIVSPVSVSCNIL